MDGLPRLLPVPELRKRLLAIFPEGTPKRRLCTREMSARTIFVMLYVGAVAGRGQYVRPDQVTRMTDKQAALQSDDQRRAWARKSLGRAKSAIRGRWYAVNTREPIRDETLREGLIPTGAAVARSDLPTTSSAPRYALSIDFAALLDPELVGEPLTAATQTWQRANLSASALARIQIVQRGAVAAREGVMVAFPNGETRRLSHGPSSIISKGVIEEFATRFLGNPGVVFLSESGNKVVARDQELAKAIGLEILPDRLLPDIVLVDLISAEPLIVFVEVVATDGPVSKARRNALLGLATEAGFGSEQVAFVSAYLDRDQASFKRTISDLAWDSFAWLVSEPDEIIQLRSGEKTRGKHLVDLI